MRANKRADRSMNKLGALLAEYGVSQEVIEEVKENAPSNKEAISRQGEAVLLFLEHPAKFTAKLCRRCEEAFGTNYRAVAYCSDSCRAKDMEKALGVKWDWLKSEEERWGGEAPLIIPPPALQKIQQLTDWFASIQYTQNQIESQRRLDQEANQSQLQEQQVQGEQALSQDYSHTSPDPLLPELSTTYIVTGESPFDFE